MNKLAQTLIQKDTILFIGSGISLWSGLPSWGGLIERLAQYIEAMPGGNASLVRSEAQRGELLQAASYGFSKLSAYQVGQFVKEVCLYGTAKPSEVHKKIVSLGPSCYITTNYDTLLEDSIRLYCPSSVFRSAIVNRQLIPAAEIIQGSARDFIFKLHGDAGDGDTIILTQEQYKKLVPGGEFHAALKAAETLLASRPVVYLGFGLRDPDFIYLRNLLSNTYKGGVRDHYAIMADIGQEETDYWRSQYGIHLVGYNTIKGPDGRPDHSGLGLLLDNLLSDINNASSSTSTPMLDAKEEITEGIPDRLLLSLTRYAGKLMQSKDIESGISVKVYTRHPQLREPSPISQQVEFNGWDIKQFLVNGPERALLLGLPGAGKSYAVRYAVAHLATSLHEECLKESYDKANIIIPFVVDLKRYQGSLWEMLQEALPTALSLDYIISNFKTKIFLDSFNEMPREFRENGHYELDFTEFAKKLNNSSIIICSRTNDGLVNLAMNTFEVQNIDSRLVEAKLAENSFSVNKEFEKELKLLLQKPLYFSLVSSGAAKLRNNAKPKDIYESLLFNLQNRFFNHFNVNFNIKLALSLSAFDSISRGEEAQSLSHFLQSINQQLYNQGIVRIRAEEIANWLVSENIIIPYHGGLVSFFHQSMTEYLAAFELANQYQQNKDLLRDVVRLKRWDQALFLTLSLLPEVLAHSFLETIIALDFELAISAAKYLEVDSEDIVFRILEELPNNAKLYHMFDRVHDRALSYDLPLSAKHAPLLRQIAEQGDVLGTAALERLSGFGLVDKEYLFSLLYRFRLDQNFARNGIAKLLEPLITLQDIPRLRALADQMPERNYIPWRGGGPTGFIVAVAIILRKFDLVIIRNDFLSNQPINQLSETIHSIMHSLLIQYRSFEAFCMAADYLEKGELWAMNVISVYAFNQINAPAPWDYLSANHIDVLINALDIDSQSQSSSILQSLGNICEKRQDLAMYTIMLSSKFSGLKKAVLLYTAKLKDDNLIFDFLESIKVFDDTKGVSFAQFLSNIRLNWNGRAQLFSHLLKLRNLDLAFAVMATNDRSPYINRNSGTVGMIDIGSEQDFLEWILSIKHLNNGGVFAHLFGYLVLFHTPLETQNQFIRLFNNLSSPYKSYISNCILSLRRDLSLSDFDEESIAFLIASLAEPEALNDPAGGLLEHIADEAFAINRILPLIQHADGVFKKNLVLLLRKIGAKYGKRYFL